MKYSVLVAEDNIDILNILVVYLESKDYEVFQANNGVEAYQIMLDNKIDLALLDIMMPKMDGFTLTKKIRGITNIPILLLTAKSETNDKILGLNLGADDYITKPFDPIEVLARVDANIRRFYKLNDYVAQDKDRHILTSGELVLNTETLILTKNEEEIIITPNEYKLLSFLMRSAGRVYTKTQICEAINGEFYSNYENAIMVHISHLREKIEDDPKSPKYIKNIRGVGYKVEKI